MKVIMHRFGNTGNGVFGKIHIKQDGKPIFTGYTVEQPWNNNQPFKSCIPSGGYHLEPFTSERYGETFCIIGPTVSKYQEEGKKRFACLFHAANLPRNVQGCIGIGKIPSVLEGEWAVGRSRDAVSEFLSLLYDAGDKIPFIIRQPEVF